MDLPIGKRMSPRFEQLLQGFDIAELERCESASYGLFDDLTLGYMNPAWFRFAQQNGALNLHHRWGLGDCVLRATSSSLRLFFAENFHRCLADRKTWQHEYECSSASLFRRFRMSVDAIAGGRGLVVVNALLVEAAHDPDERRSYPPLTELYLGEHGLILQCMHCRRVQRVDGSQQWDWVPAFVATSDHATGGLCRACYRRHYPAAPMRP